MKNKGGSGKKTKSQATVVPMDAMEFEKTQAAPHEVRISSPRMDAMPNKSKPAAPWEEAKAK